MTESLALVGNCRRAIATVIDQLIPAGVSSIRLALRRQNSSGESEARGYLRSYMGVLGFQGYAYQEGEEKRNEFRTTCFAAGVGRQEHREVGGY